MMLPVAAAADADCCWPRLIFRRYIFDATQPRCRCLQCAARYALIILLPHALRATRRMLDIALRRLLMMIPRYIFAAALPPRRCFCHDACFRDACCPIEMPHDTPCHAAMIYAAPYRCRLITRRPCRLR